ncbi:hypothetical protein [Roseovarius pelagicus]|uniref:Uncharacterized protein n=1 Tax=Roseovarius pelagicus TaxID=2980108 RepID=A0ABY6DMM9_9RHOB|nr:hypothetical protein [Roseovarius pelagicus]UXX85025.1 hypothetical protein N7U68_10450 [Roseovarius pelagicus]
MPKSITLKLLAFAASLLIAPSILPAQVLSLYFLNKDNNGAYTVVPLADMQNETFENLENGSERVLDIYATEFYIGDLPDLWLNDVALSLSASTDVTQSASLGENGEIGMTIVLREKDDTRVEGYQGRALIRKLPFKSEIQLTVSLTELDGASKKNIEMAKNLIVSQTGSDTKSLIDLDLGNSYVKLAMAVYNIIDEEKKKDDEIWNSPFTFLTNPPEGLMPLRSGEWLLISTDNKKKRYNLDVPRDVTYVDRKLKLADEAVTNKKRMPTYLILSVVSGIQAIPEQR